jgi:hypothetical protein
MNGNGRGASNKRGRNAKNDKQPKGRGRGESDERLASGGAPQRSNKNKNKNNADRRKQADNFNELHRPTQNQKRLQRPGRDRPKWVPPELLKAPIPTPLCPVCNKPIEDLASAITDKLSGEAAHFDCVRKKIIAAEDLGREDEVSYIGGGRFGVISFDSQEKRYFKIKKIIEYEGKELRAEWRGTIADHFSLT